MCKGLMCLYFGLLSSEMKNDVYGEMRFTLIVPLYVPYFLFSVSHLICPILFWDMTAPLIRWFGQVQRWNISELVRNIDSWNSRDLKNREKT